MVKILLLEDNKADIELIKTEFSRAKFNCELKVVKDKESYKKRLKEFNPNIILSDYTLTQFDGLLALKIALELVPDTPFIIITGTLSDEIAVSCLKKGAWDYVIKDRLVKLVPSIENALKLKKQKIERKKAEEAVKESEEKFSSVVENSHEGIFIVDNAYKFSYVNDKFCKILGYLRKDLIGFDFRKFLEKKSKTMVAERYTKRQLGEKVPKCYEFDIVTKKGEIRTLEISISILKNTSGTVFTVGQVLDVTEQNRNLKSLQEHDALNNALFEYSPIETIVVNNKGEIMRVNKAVKTNRSRLPKSGDMMYKDFASKYSIDMFEELMDCIKTGKIKVFPEIKYREDRYYYATIAPFPQGAIITAQDVTEQKLAQDEVNRSLQEKEVLLNEIHHRVKNNMQIITSLLKLQSQNIKDKRSLELFQNSQNRVRSMALIHEKLYRTRDFSSIDFGEYIRSLTTHLLISYHILPSQVEIDINIKDIIFNMNVAIPCGLIINELVTNSIKHAFSNCREGKIEVTITKKGTNGYSLVVKDNGQGLPPEAVDLKDPTTLGLELVSSLVSQLKGTLQYQFKKGAVFSIEFKMS